MVCGMTESMNEIHMCNSERFHWDKKQVFY